MTNSCLLDLIISVTYALKWKMIDYERCHKFSSAYFRVAGGIGRLFSWEIEKFPLLALFGVFQHMGFVFRKYTFIARSELNLGSYWPMGPNLSSNEAWSIFFRNLKIITKCWQNLRKIHILKNWKKATKLQLSWDSVELRLSWLQKIPTKWPSNPWWLFRDIPKKVLFSLFFFKKNIHTNLFLTLYSFFFFFFLCWEKKNIPW